MKPAPASATMAHVEFLRSRYRARPAEAPHLADADARLWIEALAHWPADVADAACYGWMIADKPFAPCVPGELLPFGDPILARRSAWLWRVERMIEALARKGEDAPEAEHSLGRGLRALAEQVRRALAPRGRRVTPQAPLTDRARAQRRATALAALSPGAAQASDGPRTPPLPREGERSACESTPGLRRAVAGFGPAEAGEGAPLRRANVAANANEHENGRRFPGWAPPPHPSAPPSDPPLTLRAFSAQIDPLDRFDGLRPHAPKPPLGGEGMQNANAFVSDEESSTDETRMAQAGGAAS